jgi:hypothetical protein
LTSTLWVTVSSMVTNAWPPHSFVKVVSVFRGRRIHFHHNFTLILSLPGHRMSFLRILCIGMFPVYAFPKALEKCV